MDCIFVIFCALWIASFVGFVASFIYVLIKKQSAPVDIFGFAMSVFAVLITAVALIENFGNF